jgi:hypothetical protein
MGDKVRLLCYSVGVERALFEERRQRVKVFPP